MRIIILNGRRHGKSKVRQLVRMKPPLNRVPRNPADKGWEVIDMPWDDSNPWMDGGYIKRLEQSLTPRQFQSLYQNQWMPPDNEDDESEGA